MRFKGFQRIKGSYGDRARLKKTMIIGAIAILLFIAALVVIGYIRFGTRKNIFTILAILSVLPFAKIGSILSTLLPYPSITKQQADKLSELTEGLEAVYDIVLATNRSAIPIDCLIIEEGRVIALSPVSDKKQKLLETTIRDFYSDHGFKHMAVVIETEYEAFCERIAAMSHKDTKNRRTAELRRSLLINCV